jgi:hypothetical protein
MAIIVVILMTRRAAWPRKTCLKGSMPAMVSSTAGSCYYDDIIITTDYYYFYYYDADYRTCGLAEEDLFEGQHQ